MTTDSKDNFINLQTVICHLFCPYKGMNKFRTRKIMTVFHTARRCCKPVV